MDDKLISVLQVVNVTGNQDICFYNFLCAHPLGALRCGTCECVCLRARMYYYNHSVANRFIPVFKCVLSYTALSTTSSVTLVT